MQIVISALLGVIAADKLNNVYLPPSNARTAGGTGSFLSTPFQPRNGLRPFVPNQPSSPVYGAPQLNYRDQQSYYSSKPAQITRYSNENNGDGSYQFDYETDNKISQHEVGQLRNVGTNQEATVVHGSYSYAAPNGQVLTVDYVADENGFRPSGAHLPTPPPIPEAILKSIQQNAAVGISGSYDEGQYREYDRNVYNQNGGYRY